MKNTLKLIRRFVLILMGSVILLFALNVVLLIWYTSDEANTRGGWQSAEEVAENLSEEEAGKFRLSESGSSILKEMDAWAILVADGTGDVVWHSENLPPEIPLHYSAADISWSTRGYIKDYPTTTASYGDALVILGHPKQKYWKQMWNTWSYDLIKNAPGIFVKVACANLAAISAIYLASTMGILRSVKPILAGIEALPEEKEVHVREKGLLSELAGAINRASDKLQRQEYALKKKERAQANWIAGVSHDIRTPLSMVMGYAGQLEEDQELPEKARGQAKVIRLQSVRMKNLVNDLNLYSKLEYHMQPLKLQPMNLVAVVRFAAADFMNLDLEQKYPVEWIAREELQACVVQGDKELLGRALNNIFNNIRVHNPEGCEVVVEMEETEEMFCILIEDNGAGMDDRQLARLGKVPHYMRNDGSGKEERHGLGLLIVRQIVEAHGGTVQFLRGREGGFGVKITFTLSGTALTFQ